MYTIYSGSKAPELAKLELEIRLIVKDEDIISLLHIARFLNNNSIPNYELFMEVDLLSFNSISLNLEY
jgi:hypothetical protein